MTPARYSGTPLPRKLGVAPGSRLLVLDPPDDFDATLGALPDDVERVGARAARLDVVLLFATRATVVRRRFGGLAKRLAPKGVLWVAWPKKASGVATDLAFDVVQGVGLASGLVDTKVCAIDDTWSGLAFRARGR